MASSSSNATSRKTNATPSRTGSLHPGSKEAAPAERLRSNCSGCFANRGVDEVVELAAVATMDEADEVAEERRVRSLPALVCRDAGELEQLVDLVLRESECRRVLACPRREPVARFLQPVVHGRSLVPHASGEAPA